MPSPPQKKGKAWIVALAVVAAFFILSILGMNSCSNAFSSAFTSSASTDSADYLTQDAVAIINIDGTIQYDGSNSSPEGLKYQLDRAETNPHIKAVVLRINSGGGVATAGEEMALYVKQFSKPIVVSSASINASAAYEISSQADYIFTAKTTAIGSIGTAMSITDLSGLYEKLGIHIDDITSAESKDSSYGNRPLTEEERAYYQDMVNEINETFIKTVAEGRGMTVEEVRVLATGLTFTGMTGVQNGLADSIGTLEDAVVKAAELSYIQGGYTTVYLYSGTSLSMLDLLGILGSASSQQDVLGRLKELEGNGSFAN
jgi:protease-4